MFLSFQVHYRNNRMQSRDSYCHMPPTLLFFLEKDFMQDKQKYEKIKMPFVFVGTCRYVKKTSFICKINYISVKKLAYNQVIFFFIYKNT